MGSASIQFFRITDFQILAPQNQSALIRVKVTKGALYAHNFTSPCNASRFKLQKEIIRCIKIRVTISLYNDT